MPPRSSTRRRPAKKRTHHGLPQFEQRHKDMIGLGLIALAVFYAFVIWLQWDGGEIGSRSVEGMRWLVGELHQFAPFAMLLAGGWLVMQPVLPAVRPVRTGLICLFGAL